MKSSHQASSVASSIIGDWVSVLQAASTSTSSVDVVTDVVAHADPVARQLEPHAGDHGALAGRGDRRVGAGVVAQLVEHVDHQRMDEVLLVAGVDAPERRRRGVDLAVGRDAAARSAARLWIQAHTSDHWSNEHLRENLFSACHSTRPSELSQSWRVGTGQRRHARRERRIGRVAGEADVAGRARAP